MVVSRRHVEMGVIAKATDRHWVHSRSHMTDTGSTSSQNLSGLEWLIALVVAFFLWVCWCSYRSHRRQRGGRTPEEEAIRAELAIQRANEAREARHAMPANFGEAPGSGPRVLQVPPVAAGGGYWWTTTTPTSCREVFEQLAGIHWVAGLSAIPLGIIQSVETVLAAGSDTEASDGSSEASPGEASLGGVSIGEALPGEESLGGASTGEALPGEESLGEASTGEASPGVGWDQGQSMMAI